VSPVPEPAPVLVVVGTDYHPFDRLVGWMDRWLETRRDSVRCLVQYGSSTPPRVADGTPFLDHDEVQRAMGGAQVVVSHGGPTTIAEARRHGHYPLVVPRDPQHGEHVDDHQMRFARRLAEDGLVELVASAEELAASLEARLRGQWTRPRTTNGGDPAESARRFGALVEDLVAGRAVPQRPGALR
jgi:UDP-N-acetylglucosamine transferase subunit ALG13